MKMTPNLEKILQSADITEQELKDLLKGQRPEASRVYNLEGQDAIYGVISDSHIGHKCYDANLMDLAAEVFHKRKVEFVLHGGDICEGHYEAKRPGHVFEMEHIGGDEQVNRAIKELKKLELPIIAITGNHEHNTFYKQQGFDIGTRLAEQVPNFTYLGNAHGFVKMAFGHRIQLIHPDGGASYAISYKSQKIVESLESGSKPAVLHIGHFHKAEYLFYRGIHAIQNGCLESQTPFQKNNHLAAHRGFWVVSLTVGKEGVKRIVPEFYPAYGK